MRATCTRVFTRCRLAAVLMMSAVVVGPASAQGQTVQELRLRWESTSGAAVEFVEGQPPPATFTTLERRRATGTLTRRRSLDLSADQIVISGLDGSGVEIYRSVMADPRILRAEAPRPTGELSGQVLYRSATEFLIDLPDDPALVEVRLYHPRWTGAAFSLDPIVSIQLQ